MSIWVWLRVAWLTEHLFSAVIGQCVVWPAVKLLSQPSVKLIELDAPWPYSYSWVLPRCENVSSFTVVHNFNYCSNFNAIFNGKGEFLVMLQIWNCQMNVYFIELSYICLHVSHRSNGNDWTLSCFLLPLRLTHDVGSLIEWTPDVLVSALTCIHLHLYQSVSDCECIFDRSSHWPERSQARG